MKSGKSLIKKITKKNNDTKFKTIKKVKKNNFNIKMNVFLY